MVGLEEVENCVERLGVEIAAAEMKFPIFFC